MYTEFDDDIQFFCYRQEIPFLAIFGSKNQNRLFKMKTPFWLKFGLRMEIVYLKLTLEITLI